MNRSILSILFLGFIALTGCKKDDPKEIDAGPTPGLVLFQTYPGWSSIEAKDGRILIVEPTMISVFLPAKDENGLALADGCYTLSGAFSKTGADNNVLTYAGIAEGQAVTVTLTPELLLDNTLRINMNEITAQNQQEGSAMTMRPADPLVVADLLIGMTCNPGDVSNRLPAVDEFLKSNWEETNDGFYAFVKGNSLSYYTQKADKSCYYEAKDFNQATKTDRTISYKKGEEELVLTPFKNAEGTLYLTIAPKGGTTKTYTIVKSTVDPTSLTVCEDKEPGTDAIALFKSSNWESTDGKHFLFGTAGTLVQYRANTAVTCFTKISTASIIPAPILSYYNSTTSEAVGIVATALSGGKLRLQISITKNDGSFTEPFDIEVVKTTKTAGSQTICTDENPDPSTSVVDDFLASNWQEASSISGGYEWYFFPKNNELFEYDEDEVCLDKHTWTEVSKDKATIKYEFMEDGLSATMTMKMTKTGANTISAETSYTLLGAPISDIDNLSFVKTTKTQSSCEARVCPEGFSRNSDSKGNKLIERLKAKSAKR